MEEVYKIVDFSKCISCKNIKVSEWDEPCHECLNTPTRYGTRMPLYYKPNDESPKKNKSIVTEESSEK